MSDNFKDISIYTTSLKAGVKIAQNPIDKVSLENPLSSDISLTPDQESGNLNEQTRNSVLTMHTNMEFQTIEGIGGAFNENGGEALTSLPEELQKQVLQSLFDKDKGCGFTYCRTPLGASDFSLQAYSYCDVKGDYAMEHFTTEQDDKYLLPYIKDALKLNPELKLCASPWSPPGWMKYSGVIDYGIEHGEKSTLIKDPKIYKAYAIYFAKYIKEYEKKGVKIDRVHIQNEPDTFPIFPGCNMTVEEMTILARDYIGPELKKHNIDTELWGGTFRALKQLDAYELMMQEGAEEIFPGVGVQYSRPDYVAEVGARFPSTKFMATEGMCFRGENSIDQAILRFKEIAGYINAGCVSYHYWNMILNETGLSGWDWKQNTLISIDRESKSVTYTPDYAVLSLISRFIRPGSVRFPVCSPTQVIGVKNGNERTVIVPNFKKESLFEIREGNRSKVLTLPADSLCAIKYSI